MPYKIDLEPLIEPISKCRSQGMSIRQTASHVGIHRDTLRRFLEEGKHAKSGIKKKLWIAWCKAEAGVTFKTSQTVVQRATEFGITKIQETEKVDKEGNPYTEIKTVQTGPDANIGLKFLEKFADEWGRFEDEPSGDTDTGTDKSSPESDGNDALERQIETLEEWAKGNPDTDEG